MKIEPQLLEIPLNLIDINPKYAYRQFNDEAIKRDVVRVKQQNHVAPLIVSRQPNGRFILVTGHRRLLLASLAGFKTITCAIFNDEPRLIDHLQTLDWIHDIGEHVILKHPYAHQFYLRKKAELLKRTIPPSLQNDNTWAEFVREAVKEALNAMLHKLWGERYKEIVDKLYLEFKKYTEYDQIIKTATEIIAAESFKVDKLDNVAPTLINALISLSQLIVQKDLAWVDTLNTGLSTPTNLMCPITNVEAVRIFNLAPTNLEIYKRCIVATLSAANNNVLTQKHIIRKNFGASSNLGDAYNYQFIKESLATLKELVSDFKGRSPSDIFPDVRFTRLCQDDYLQRLNIQLQNLYLKLKHDEARALINKEYIELCFDQLNIFDAIYQPLQITPEEKNALNMVIPAIKQLFVSKILAARDNRAKVAYSVLYHIDRIYQDVTVRPELQKIFRHKLLERRSSLEVEYQYLDSQPLKATSTAELLGTLLLIRRSAKHFLKQSLAEKAIFFKKRMRFATIDTYLEKDRILKLEDGINEFVFMIELNHLGSVSTTLKVQTTGNFDYIVQQFHTYRKDLTKPEKNELSEIIDAEEDMPNEGTPIKSSFYKMAKAMVAKGKPAPNGAVVDQTIAKWLANVLKLTPPDLSIWPLTLRNKIIPLLRVQVFLMFFIEGLRNPGALVIHPLVLKELIDQPLRKLDEYISTGKFVMTPIGSKAEGEHLHGIMVPQNDQLLIKDIITFNYNGMAQREVEVLQEHNNGNLADIENRVLDMFNLGR